MLAVSQCGAVAGRLRARRDELRWHLKLLEAHVRNLKMRLELLEWWIYDLERKELAFPPRRSKKSMESREVQTEPRVLLSPLRQGEAPERRPRWADIESGEEYCEAQGDRAVVAARHRAMSMIGVFRGMTDDHGHRERRHRGCVDLGEISRPVISLSEGTQFFLRIQLLCPCLHEVTKSEVTIP